VQTGTIDAKYFLFLANHGLSEDKPGTFVGQHAAPAIIDRRANSIPPIRPEQALLLDWKGQRSLSSSD
jgi:hypothetical protein